MFIESKTWGGLPAQEMAEVHSRIGASLGHSLRSEQPRRKRKKAEPGRKQGVIKTFDAARSFGFIRVRGEEDVFFHVREVSDAADTMNFINGDRVSFEPGEDNRGRPCAKDVRPIK